ncbi:MAG: M14 family metallopeptidase [Candidatus Wallbacteria bacterium]
MKLNKLSMLMGALGLSVVFSVNSAIAQTNVNIEGSKNTPVVKEEEPKIVKFFIENKKQVEDLANAGVDIAEVRKDYVIAIITDSALKSLGNRAVRYQVVNDNANSLLSKRAVSAKYHTFDQIEKYLKDCVTNYPDICKLEIIGNSCENRPIYGLKISGNVNQNQKKPAGLVMGLHHAREWISAEVPVALIKTLTENYSKDAEIKKIVDERNIWIVPVVNPDGLVYSQKNSKMWRKNRRVNSDKSYGVDPNRNYGYQWGNVGSSNYGGADTYHGTGPFSEPCTSAIKKLAERERFISTVSFHSYSEEVLYPFGYAYEAVAKDNDLLKKLATEMAKLNKYEPMKSSDLYPAMGDTDDFLYGTMGALAFTIELGSQFVPNDSEVDSICDGNVKACLYLLKQIGTVHASTHPDFSSKLNRAIATYSYRASSSRGLDNDAKTELINLLNPVNDSNGKNFDEFMSEVAKMDLNSKKILAPVFREVKDMYMQDVINKAGNAKPVLKTIEKLQTELQQIED